MASKKKKPAVTADEAQKSRGKKTVKVAEFATLMKTTRQCVYQWIDRGCPYRNGPEGKEIPLADGIEWVIEFKTWEIQEHRQAQNKDIPNEKEEAALERRAKRLLAEHDLLEKTRKVVPVTDLTEFVDRVFGTFSGVASGRLKNFERDIVKAKTPAEARKITDRMHHDLMSGAIQYATQLEDEAAEIQRERAVTAAEAKGAAEALAAAEEELALVDETAE